VHLGIILVNEQLDAQFFFYMFISVLYIFRAGTAVAQWLRYCATNQKVAVSIPNGVMEFFTDIILPIALWPWGRLSL
jgi:hypothetical protein